MGDCAQLQFLPRTPEVRAGEPVNQVLQSPIQPCGQMRLEFSNSAKLASVFDDPEQIQAAFAIAGGAYLGGTTRFWNPVGLNKIASWLRSVWARQPENRAVVESRLAELNAVPRHPIEVGDRMARIEYTPEGGFIHWFRNSDNRGIEGRLLSTVPFKGEPTSQVPHLFKNFEQKVR